MINIKGNSWRLQLQWAMGIFFLIMETMILLFELDFFCKVRMFEMYVWLKLYLIGKELGLI